MSRIRMKADLNPQLVRPAPGIMVRKSIQKGLDSYFRNYEGLLLNDLTKIFPQENSARIKKKVNQIGVLYEKSFQNSFHYDMWNMFYNKLSNMHFANRCPTNQAAFSFLQKMNEPSLKIMTHSNSLFSLFSVKTTYLKFFISLIQLDESISQSNQDLAEEIKELLKKIKENKNISDESVEKAKDKAKKEIRKLEKQKKAQESNPKQPKPQSDDSSDNDSEETSKNDDSGDHQSNSNDSQDGLDNQMPADTSDSSNPSDENGESDQPGEDGDESRDSESEMQMDFDDFDESDGDGEDPIEMDLPGQNDSDQNDQSNDSSDTDADGNSDEDVNDDYDEESDNASDDGSDDDSGDSGDSGDSTQTGDGDQEGDSEDADTNPHEMGDSPADNQAEQSGQGLGNDLIDPFSKSLDEFINNPIVKPLFEKLDNDLKEEFKNISKMHDKSDLDESFKNIGSNTVRSAAQELKTYDPNHIKELVNQLSEIQMNDKQVVNLIKNLLNKSLNYFSSLSKPVYEGFIEKGRLHNTQNLHYLHPVLRAGFIEDIQNREQFKRGKIDVYIDISGSMGHEIHSIGMSRIMFAKTLLFKLFKRELIQELFVFGDDVREVKLNLINVISVSDGNYGTNMDDVLRNILRTKRNSIVITDAESDLCYYSPHAYFIGLPGSDFSDFKNVEEYQSRGQICVFDGNRIRNIDKNGYVI